MSPLSRSIHESTHDLLELIPGIRDGNVDAIHDARVATRRLRAALDVIGDRDGGRFEEAAELVRRASRALGKARDIDVSLDLLADLERRATVGAHAITTSRTDLLRQRTAARRRMVKKLDSLHLQRVGTLLSASIPRVGQVIAARARERARDLIAAIDHASGVYFPKRAHAARIGIKKLRYLLEFSETEDAETLKLLRKSQQTLGDIQDRQVLHEIVAAHRSSDASSDSEVDALLGMLEAENSVLYERFLERRANLRAVCERVAANGHSTRPASAALLTIGAITAGSIWGVRRALGNGRW